MTKELFDQIFDWGIRDFIAEIQANNPRIKTNDLQECKQKAYENYERLIRQYRTHIFSKTDNCLLDRHRVASCICGAFLRTDFFNKTDLWQKIVESKERIEAVFFYVNELLAFHAGCKYLSCFMIYDNSNKPDVASNIIEKFPYLPKTTLVKTGFLNCVLFNLAQVKDESQIGIEHYDLYSYAMFFFKLEQDFYRDI